MIRYKIWVQQKEVAVKYSNQQSLEAELQEVCGNLQLQIARLRRKQSQIPLSAEEMTMS